MKIIEDYEDYFTIMHDARYDATYGKGPKMLIPKQTVQRLPIALAQVKACNTSENLLTEIYLIIHSLYQAKEIT